MNAAAITAVRSAAKTNLVRETKPQAKSSITAATPYPGSTSPTDASVRMTIAESVGRRAITLDHGTIVEVTG